MKVQMDLKKIFLTPPTSMSERIILFVMLVITFMVFFMPLRFSSVHPVEAIIISALPALSISWSWVLLLRALFRKSEYIKK